MSSSFIDVTAAAGWSSAQWNGHLQDLHRAGIDTVILNKTIDDGTAKSALYPTTVPGYTQAQHNGEPVDVVGAALERLAASGMHAWIGLQLDNARWYNEGGQNDPSWLASQADLSGDIAADILNQYGAYREQITGWYFPGEENPWADWGNGTELHHDFYVELSRRLDAIDPSLEIRLPPYYAFDGGKPSSGYETYLSQALVGTSIDVVALQTGTLTGDRVQEIYDPVQRAATIAEWTGAVSRGVAKAGIDAEKWANIELFEPNGNPATVQDVVAAMQAASPNVSAFTSWSYTNHWSSWRFGVDWWSTPYRSYVEVLKTTAAGVTRVASPDWSSTSVTVKQEPGASYSIRSRDASGNRSAAASISLAATTSR